MNPLTCSSCGFIASPGEGWCRQCGSRLPGPVASNPLGPDQGAAPYAAVPQYGRSFGLQPQYGSAGEAGFEQGVWRDGKTLVMHKHARLPDYCIKCGSPANGCHLHKKLSWHHPALALLVFAGVLIYLIVALVVRKSAAIDISLCENHLKKHRTAVIVSWLIFLAGVAFIVLAIAEESGGSALFGIVLLLASAIYAGVWAKIVTVRKIDDHHVWLRRIDESFLAMLPSLTRG